MTRRWTAQELAGAAAHFKDTSVPPQPEAPRKRAVRGPVTPESAILAGCLQLLAVHPKVAWAERMNTGAMKLEGRFIKFGFPGLSDIIGQLKTGAFLAVEVKRAGKLPTSHQNAFLGRVNLAGGFGCHVDSVDRLAMLLARLPAANANAPF